jgi:hypothetical protein
MDAIHSCLCYERCVPDAELPELPSDMIRFPPENLDVCFYCVYIVLNCRLLVLSLKSAYSEIKLLSWLLLRPVTNLLHVPSLPLAAACR